MKQEQRCRAGSWLRACLIAAGGFTLLHVLTLPLVIPYDGHEYIDFAAVLFSERFPRDWTPPIRTPGYPLLLKASFAALGRQPSAIVTANALLAWAMLLVIARATRSLAGVAAAGSAVLAVAVFPLSVAYQHHALTESGVAFFLVLTTGILLLPAVTPAAGWQKSSLLAGALAAGYFQRQSLQFVIPIASLLFPLSVCCPPGVAWLRGVRHPPFRWWLIAIQTLMVPLVPIALALLWEPYLDSAGIRDYMLKQGLVRQAVLPPGDPLLGPAADTYAAAVQQGWEADRLVSGIMAQRIGVLADTLYSRLDPAPAMFRRLAAGHPDRYAAGVLRTLLLFAGYPAAQSTDASAEHAVFGPTLDQGTNRIDPGPAALDAVTRGAFSQRTAASLGSRLLWWIAPWFDHGLVPVGFLVAIAIAAGGILARNVHLVIVAAMPLAYLFSHACLLASEDRYAFPAQPILLATAVATAVWAAERRLVRRR